MTEAIYDAGYNASSRFYSKSTKLLGMTPTAWRAGGAGARIRFAVGQCAYGAILAAASDKGVWAIVLGYLFFGDVVQFWTLVGAAVICGAGLALLLLEREAARRGREAKDIETPVLPEA